MKRPYKKHRIHKRTHLIKALDLKYIHFIRLFACFLIILSVEHLSAQVVYTEPQFPNQQDDIVVFFDASEGNTALKDFNGTVYAHTGVITNLSQNDNDWQHVIGEWGTADDRVRMIREKENLYSLSYNIESFYNIQPGETVKQLAFVFRNQDGSIVGREADGTDIFYDVFEEGNQLITELQNPTEDQIVFVGSSFPVSLDVNQEANITVFLNGNEVIQTYNNMLDLSLTLEAEGTANIRIEISTENESATIERNIFGINQTIASMVAPADIVSGLNVPDDDNLIFMLTAPAKQHVFLLCPANGFSPDLNYRMTPTNDGNAFWISLSQDLFSQGNQYYQYLVDGAIKIADPYSTMILDPVHDSNINTNFANAYPQGAEGHVSIAGLHEEEFVWSVDAFQPKDKEDLIIYELLMRDFLDDQQFTTLTDTLDYLQKLGVNAIELMPIQEFEGNQSWGYNPSYHMALDKAYGSRNEFKQFVDECHRRDIAVILDIVYNHAFAQSPLCQLYWDQSLSQPASDNPWLNPTARHPFNVGFDFNHESVFTQAWVKQVLAYWIEEFKIDGFRFDLSKGFTQKNSVGNPDLMARYDQSRIDILTDYAEHIWSLDNDNIVILEHFANNDEERVLAQKGMLLWNNNQFQYAEAAMGYVSNLGGTDYTRRDMSEPNLVSYLESHDEERMAYKINRWGNSSRDYNTQDLETLIERMVAAYTIFMTIPGPKMVWQFSELGFDFSINRCVQGNISENCRLDPKPAFWSEQFDPFRQDLYHKLATLFQFKANTPALSSTNFILDDDDEFIKTVHITHEEMNVVSIANYNVVPATVDLSFPETGTWYELYSGVEFEVKQRTETLALNPGGYKIFTSTPSPFAGSFSTSTLQIEALDLEIFPNPIGKEAELHFSKAVQQVEIFDIHGQRTVTEKGPVQKIDQLPLIPGIYIIKGIIDSKKFIHKIVKS